MPFGSKYYIFRSQASSGRRLDAAVGHGSVWSSSCLGGTVSSLASVEVRTGNVDVAFGSVPGRRNGPGWAGPGWRIGLFTASVQCDEMWCVRYLLAD